VAGGTTLVAGIAGRYATALFDLAREENQLDEITEALRGLHKLLGESKDFARLVASPVFSTAEQAGALAAISKQAGIPDLAANFLQLLAKKRRLFILGDVITGYLKRLADHRNEVTADVTSAMALTDEQTDELKATLKAKTGRSVTLNERVDPSILGGLVVKIGSRMVDSSMRTKLNNLKIAMKEVG
jgi:F-type H+-transporting ATPase subunit delta